MEILSVVLRELNFQVLKVVKSKKVYSSCKEAASRPNTSVGSKNYLKGKCFFRNITSLLTIYV